MWQPDQEETPEITPAEAKSKFDAGDVRLLDVREVDEWEEVHIPGAKLIPLSQLERRFNELDTDDTWVVVCRSGGRSAAATDFLRGMGYNATNMIGGMMLWLNRGLPGERGMGDPAGRK